MAIYNEILAGRFARGLQKLFAMKGGVPAKQLAGEITPVLPLLVGVENRFLESWDRFATPLHVAAGGAGFNSAIRIRNPKGSNLIAVFEKIAFLNIDTAAADTPSVQIAPAIADYATAINFGNTRLDARTSRQTTGLIGTQANDATAVGLGQSVMRVAFQASQMVDCILFEEQELTLLPGDTLQGITGAQNFPLEINLMWRERFLEDSERQ